VLWLLTTIYAIAYFGTKPQLSRFFGFFSLCVAATTGPRALRLADLVLHLLRTPDAQHLAARRAQAGPRVARRPRAAIFALRPAGQRGAALGDHLAGSTTGPVLFTDPPDLSGIDAWSLRAIFALFILGVG
jgi:multicomponent Na+:H+ antiporter subunit D